MPNFGRMLKHLDHCCFMAPCKIYGLLFNNFKKNIIDQTHNLLIVK